MQAAALLSFHHVLRLCFPGESLSVTTHHVSAYLISARQMMGRQERCPSCRSPIERLELGDFVVSFSPQTASRRPDLKEKEGGEQPASGTARLLGESLPRGGGPL